MIFVFIPVIGKNSLEKHNHCSIGTKGIHFSVRITFIYGSAISANSVIDGKVINAVILSILREICTICFLFDLLDDRIGNETSVTTPEIIPEIISE